MTLDLTTDARQRLDAHLDAVEQALSTSGRSREQRRGIVDDLETQILDMLAKQSPTPTPSDVETILTRLDPPAAYGDAPRPASGLHPTTPSAAGVRPIAQPRLSPTSVVGFICILMSLLPLAALAIFVAFWASYATSPAARSLPPPNLVMGEPLVSGRIYLFVGILMTPLAAIGTLLGWVADGQIRSSKGTLCGKGLALFDGLFYPGLVILIITARLAYSL